MVIGAFADFVETALTVHARTPMVAVAALDAPIAGVYVTTVDHYLGARMALDHLLSRGSRTVAHIAGPAGSLDAAARLRGWRDALTEAELAPGPLLVGDWSAESGYRAGQSLAGMHAAAADAADGTRVDAVFAGNDEMALGLLRALAEQGISVPGQVRVVGFDDIPGSAYFPPPLTTVRQDFTKLGQQCIATLVAAVDGATPESPVLVPPTLLIRSST